MCQLTNRTDTQLPLMEAMLYCPYKTWQLAKLPVADYEADLRAEKAIAAKLQKQATEIRKGLTALLAQDQAPPFYKIPHCAGCQFKNHCYQKLKDKDCISLLAGMTPKAMAKYHNKGVTTITQLSYLFKPRRRRSPNPQSSYLFELKALAIREKKTFVVEPLVFADFETSIYLDFEGSQEENHIYLIGVLVIKEGQPDEIQSFWSDGIAQEESIFIKLFELLGQYPNAPIYHYGGYESKALKKVVKHWPVIEKRIVNLLAYLRTHLYPPTYGNGLKELGAYLNYSWSDPEAEDQFNF